MEILKVGISEPVNTVLAIWMADAAGFYAAEGLKLDIVNMNGGSRGTAALASGAIDAMHVGLSSVARLNSGGADLRIVAALANVIRFTFFSTPGVTTAADLKGRVVGISSFGSESDTIVTLALERLGLDRDDVSIQEFGASGKRIAMVKSGEIAATAVNEPFASIARAEGLHVLFDLVPEQILWLFTAIVVRRADIAERRDVLTRFLRATAQGNALALTDGRTAKDVLANRAGIADPKVLDISYSDFKLLSPPDLEPAAAAARNILAQFPDASQDVHDHVDSGILATLRKDGLFAALARKYKY
jgi:ABC-type nitrate/sulfonate/bicarbonate transport system substrate-binding protein